MKEYLIIGDIHGEYATLIALLEANGFEDRNGFYQHERVHAIFVGDLIDRGPEQIKLLQFVRKMVEGGSASICMGNHEYNAIGYATARDLEHHYRPRTLRNRRQHEAFLTEVETDSPQHRAWIEWFKRIPLFLEFEQFNVVHALWEESIIAKLRPYLDEKNVLKDEHWEEALTFGSPLFRLIEKILKGVEITLPKGLHFYDSNGIKRRVARIRWWLLPTQNLEQLALVSPQVEASLKGESLSEPIPFTASKKIIFIGHYWMTGEPTLLNDRVVCVDYSVAHPEGKLVAYRYREGDTPKPENFVSIERVKTPASADI